MSRRGSQVFRLAFREYAETFAVAVLLAILLRVFVLGVYRIPTSAMSPSLLPGDFIFSYRLAYGVPVPFSRHRLGAKAPSRGDVVIVSFPERESLPYIRRVVGLPGDRVTIQQGQLIVNDKPAIYESIDNLEYETLESTKHTIENRNSSAQLEPLVVPPGYVYVLSDSRGNTKDSREFGAVPLRNVESRAFMIWFSINWSRSEKEPAFVRLDRLFTWTR